MKRVVQVCLAIGGALAGCTFGLNRTLANGEVAGHAVVQLTNGSLAPALSSVVALVDTPLRLTVDAQGAFAFQNVPPGTYTLSIIQPGTDGAPANGLVLPGVMVTSGLDLGDLRLERLGTISGVVQQSGTPVPGAVVGSDALGAVASNSQGEFTFETVAAGNYGLVVQPPGQDTLVGTSQVAVQPGQIAQVTLELNALTPLPTGSVSGFVLLSTGATPVDVNITLVGDGLSTTDMTSSSGDFAFGSVPSGVYVLTAALSGFVTTTISTVVVDTDATLPTILLEAASCFADGGECQGNQTDAGEPVPGSCAFGGLAGVPCLIDNSSETGQCTSINGQLECAALLGSACAASSDCVSGACSEGVCCDTACDGECQSCTLTGQVGTCGTLTPAESAACTLANGASCTGDADCDTTICSNGVCCATECSGECQSCSVAGMVGTCVTLSSSDSTTCGLELGASCSDDVQCLSGNCGNGSCCSTACSGQCLSCSTGTCTAVTPPENSACASPAGTACVVSSDCMSRFCVDGVCCNTRCNGTCTACDLSGSVGTCTDVPLGTDPHSQCAIGGCIPGGCNGSGVCLVAPALTVCSAGSLCDSTGDCVASGTAVPGNAAISVDQARPVVVMNGLYYVFFVEGGELEYVSSPDQYNWGNPVVVEAADAGFTGDLFSVTTNGASVAYVGSQAVAGAPLEYRQGQATLAEGITWDTAADQNASVVGAASDAGVDGTWPIYLDIALSDNGTPWILYSPDASGGFYGPWITTSSTSDGTWTAPANFPESPAGGWAIYHNAAVPMGGDAMYIVIAGDYAVTGYYWDGSTLGAAQLMTSSAGVLGSMISNNGTASIIFGDETLMEYHYFEATSAGLSADTPLVETGWPGKVSLTVNPETGEIDAVFLLSAPTQIVMVQSNNGGVWDAAPRSCAVSPTEITGVTVPASFAGPAVPVFYTTANGMVMTTCQ